MKAATTLQREQQLIALDSVSELPQADTAARIAAYFDPGDLVIVNDAATLPATLMARTQMGQRIELRLAQRRGASLWLCLALGSGTWRDDTNARHAPPALATGARLTVGKTLSAHVVGVSNLSERLLTIRFDVAESELLAALYRQGEAIQYSYHKQRLPLSWLQTPYAGRPWAIEMPSAGRAITWDVIGRLRARGVKIARLTHSAGLSAMGLPELDACLPLQEHYDIPLETIRTIDDCRKRAGRIIAVGTTVVRALEGCVEERGRLQPGEGDTRLVIGEEFRPAVVDGVLAGLHAPGESHFRLLSAFASPNALEAAWKHALTVGCQSHELGDAMLIAPQRLSQAPSHSQR